MKKIDEMKNYPKDKKNRLSKDVIFKSLQSCAGIAKEQLDVALHARVQLENHIYRVESENLKMRGLLEGFGMNTDEISNGDTLMASNFNPHVEKMNRSIELLCMLQGVQDHDTLKAMDDYVNQRVDRETIEKKMKRFIIGSFNKANNGVYSDGDDPETVTDSMSDDPVIEPSTSAPQEDDNSNTADLRLVPAPEPVIAASL